MSVLAVETAQLHSVEVGNGGLHPLTIEDLSEGMNIDIHRSVHLIPDGEPFTPQARDRVAYENGLNAISLVTRILGEVAAVPTIDHTATVVTDGVKTERPLYTSLLVRPDRVEPSAKEAENAHFTERPTWALPFGDRLMPHSVGGKTFLYLVRQRIYRG